MHSRPRSDERRLFGVRGRALFPGVLQRASGICFLAVICRSAIPAISLSAARARPRARGSKGGAAALQLAAELWGNAGFPASSATYAGQKRARETFGVGGRVNPATAASAPQTKRRAQTAPRGKDTDATAERGAKNRADHNYTKHKFYSCGARGQRSTNKGRARRRSNSACGIV